MKQIPPLVSKYGPNCWIRYFFWGWCLAAAATLRGELIADSDCLDCHSAVEERQPLRNGNDTPGFPLAFFRKSVHANMACVDCHTDVVQIDHPAELSAVQCADCHADPAGEYTQSIHGVSHQMGASSAATCTDCHGTHDILSARNRESTVFKLNLAFTCAKCHDNKGLTEAYKIGQTAVNQHYQESIHGNALMKQGLIVAPSCNDCHGVHDIKRSVDKNARIHHQNIAKTCGECHYGVEEIYNSSVHGRLLQTKQRGPVCSDCHTAHDIEKPTNGHFKAASDKICGKCHEDKLEFYRETYHGKAMALERPNDAVDVAACYDCHGHHDVFPVSDPRSRLSAERKVETCRQCHPGVGLGFTQYQAHANHLDKENYPALHAVFVFMTALLIMVFAFFGVHTLFWLFRSIYLYLYDSKSFREAKIQTQKDEEQYTRFTPFERFLHLLVVSSFLLLVITGMPLKFYYTEWAKIMFRIMGGATTARVLHHFGALVTFAYFFLHLGSLLVNFWKNRRAICHPETGKIELQRIWTCVFGPDSMVPSWQDWRDFVDHQKWFFGKGPRPQFDRWTYWERFDYFAVFWGVAIIGTSGLIMWFPEWFTRFLPGSIINIALVVHSDEALLAAGFIFTFHFFNTHFRIEKFPMDTVIFSGRISKSEMLHERRRWYDRLVASGRLHLHRVQDDWEARKAIAKGMGFTFFGIGLILLGLIVYAMISRLGHHG